jgi:phthiocerol/phenolphthiocerol synthesis type-I polyketide synthase C
VRSSGAPRGFEVLVGPCPSEQDTWTGELEMSVADQPWLGDHRVFQAVVLPGTAMLALAINTARARTGALPHRIEQVEFSSGVTLGDGAERLTVQWRDDVSEGGSFRLLSLPAASTGWVRSAAARVLYGRPPTATSVFPEWFSTDQATGPDEFYLECAARGLEYGAAFQAVQCLQRRPDQQAVGRIELPRQLLRTNSFPILHPALWDGALQVALAVCGGDQAVVPTSIRDIRILRHPSAPVSTVWSHALRTEDGLVDVHVFDADRAPLLVMVGVELQPLQGAPDQELDDERLHSLRWIEDNGPRPGPAAATGWVIHGDGDAADALTLAIRASGAAVSRADLDAAGPMAVPPSTGSGVLFVAPQAALGAAAQQLGLLRLTELVRACLAAPTPPNLTIVTVRATTGLAGAGGAAERAAVDTAAVDPGSALYSGYTRVLRREHPELEARLIDVDAAEPEWAIDCAAEVLSPDEEDQVALRRGRRWVGRLTRGRVPEDAGPMLPARRTGRQSFQVAVSRAGSLSDIEYVPLSRRPPGPGEVEVEITVGSINFIDVMKAVGTYPDPSGGAALLGGECAGRVVAVGADVTSPRIGDRVVACAFGSLASHVVVRADHAQLIPDQLTDTQAAAMPLVLVTAWYALAELGRLERGETVLIHSAAGGVGLAALQVAQHLGATVIATAGTAAKRAHLERLGVSAVYDSRDLSWADGVRARTAGRGVDVVLNSLTGAAIPLGLDVLAEDGRFIEIGKKDIYGGRAIGLGSFRKGISLSAVDLAGLISRRPARFARVFDTVWSLVAAGELTPLPVRTYRFAAVADALREFSRGDHIGKFVVVDPGTVELISPQPMPGGRFRPDGVYVITGGLGALGLSLAEFLAANGARRLALLGRSAPGAAAEERVATLREGGSQVEIVRCDVSDETALRQALDRVRDRLGVVRGVIHTAGVLDDATTPNITAQQLTNVLGPKVHGARHLDAATAGDPLDFFVLFSSAAALVGNVGQAAYAAANAYLDALAEGRRRRGLCALSVQWGPFLDIGLAARDAGRGARLDNRGMGGFPVAEAWPALLRMLDTDQPVIGYVPINLRQWFDAYPDTAALRSWALLYEAAQGGHSGLRSPSEFLAQLAQSSVEARVGLVETKVCELSGRVLRLDAGRIERETPFKEMGLDSLMSLELRNRLESAFGMKLSPTLLWTHGNAKALAAALVQKLPAPPSAAGIDPGTDRSAEHGTASAPTSRISSHA